MEVGLNNVVQIITNNMEVGLNNVVQIITNNAVVCKVTGILIELGFPSIYWIPCVVHTVNT